MENTARRLFSHACIDRAGFVVARSVEGSGTIGIYKSTKKKSLLSTSTAKPVGAVPGKLVRFDIDARGRLLGLLRRQLVVVQWPDDGVESSGGVGVK